MTGNLLNYSSVWLLITLSNVFDFYIFLLSSGLEKMIKIFFPFANIIIYVTFSWAAVEHDLFLCRIIFESLPDIQGWTLLSTEK